MPMRFYLDHCVPRAVAEGLEARGYDALASEEDGTTLFGDPSLLDHITAAGRVAVTTDRTFYEEGHRRQASGEDFTGIIHIRQAPAARETGRVLDDLEVVAGVMTMEELRGTGTFLPFEPDPY